MVYTSIIHTYILTYIHTYIHNNYVQTLSCMYIRIKYVAIYFMHVCMNMQIYTHRYVSMQVRKDESHW